ncbi:hypothetical protein L1887_59660 [Cichorium endivia]|nr:hypothetical protein L1887_59660 [Cichorium endivia]
MRPRARAGGHRRQLPDLHHRQRAQSAHLGTATSNGYKGFATFAAPTCSPTSSRNSPSPASTAANASSSTSRASPKTPSTRPLAHDQPDLLAQPHAPHRRRRPRRHPLRPQEPQQIPEPAHLRPRLRDRDASLLQKVAEERPALNLTVEALPAQHHRRIHARPQRQAGLLALAMRDDIDPTTGEKRGPQGDPLCRARRPIQRALQLGQLLHLARPRRGQHGGPRQGHRGPLYL